MSEQPIANGPHPEQLVPMRGLPEKDEETANSAPPTACSLLVFL
jgi:hypothetical protein